MQALDRLREQQAQRLLDALQSDLRAQIRQENEEIGRRGQHKPICTEQERLQLKIARLADAKAREHLWTQMQVPKFQDVPVNDLPKTREFWAAIDLTSWSKIQLDTACSLLDLPQGGKKAELIARIQDWVHSFEIREQQEEADRKERTREEVLASGRVFACGSSFHGELGLGDRRERVVPTELETLRGQHITNVVSGFDSNFAFALTADHRVFVWGGGGKTLMDVKENTSPPLSHPTKGFTFRKQRVHSSNDTKSSGSALPSTCFLLPRLVSAFADKRVSSIACGRSEGHLSLTTTEGTCYTWGRNDYGELGVEYPAGDVQQPADVSVTTTSPVAVTISNLNGDTRITQVSVGNCHSAAITQNGELYVWGACWSGQLGLGVTKRIGVKDRRKQLYFPTPTLVEAFGRRKRVLKVSCGAVHTAVITAENRQLYTFGCGDGGRLGLGSNTDAIHPTLVTALERDVVLDVVCCSWHSIVLVQPRDCGDLETSEGFVYAFGNGLHGQLGLGKQKIAALPTRLAELHHRRVRCRAIAASSYHSCALSSDGKLFTWGQNASGCLGRVIADGSIDSAEPDVIANFSDYGVGPIISIACGHRFTVLATGPWEPLEPEPQFEINERLNRHPKFNSPKLIQGRKKH